MATNPELFEECVFRNKMARTHWVWTEAAEKLVPERKAGTPVWEMYRKTVPLYWVRMGWVEEADE